ncbi:MAG: CHAT domain-containing protein [Bacteroidota bacterium]
MNAHKPVVFLAFANEKESESRYLRALPKEQALLKEALEPAQDAGLCEVIVESNATIKSIINTFQKARYKDRIAIFHYAGHADGYQLLLETLEGSNQIAKGEGLVSFFARQKGLKLIFLNGCSTQQQSIELTEAGIPAVIGTSHSVADNIATQLAARFYSSLANGASIERAWKEAEDEVKMVEGGGISRNLFSDALQDEPEFFPWDLYTKEGAEIILDWNLPLEVDNPLFGLPELPPMHLPDQPFRYLERYEKAHAEILFGRSYYIRDLYDRATSKTSAPVILFYGQSGVGKSSMLDAGLLPRLEQSAEVVYIRRSRTLGLKATLMEALAQSGSKIADSDRLRQILDPKQRAAIESEASRLQKISEIARNLDPNSRDALEGVLTQLQESLYAPPVEVLEIDAAPSSDAVERLNLERIQTPLQAWKAIEEMAGKPLVILLDQVEETYTQPILDQPEELEDLLTEIKDIFHNPREMPQGKLILSYRKEYNPEIEELFKKFQIPREGLFLKHLDKKDIMEVITGLTQHERLKNQYRLSVDSELPSVIADDLLEDKDSPIAPVLQILLTKMWKLVEPDEYRAFSLSMYQNLKREGILMGDFLDQQLELLASENPEIVESGFALDLLYFHTTALGTAASVPRSDIKERYAHRLEDIDSLILKFKSLYLLSDAGYEMTALAHDTLAPLVQQRFRNSDRPGQRAARILENKVVEYENDAGTTLDQTDLEIVEAGVLGMQNWNETETRLVEASRVRRTKELRNRRRVRVGAMIAAAVILLFGVFALIQRSRAQTEAERANRKAIEAKRQGFIAKEQEAIAKEKAALAIIEKRRAEDSARVAREQRAIADEQKGIAEQNYLQALFQKNRADEQRLIAEENEAEAKRQSEIASANEKRAVKSEAEARREANLNAARAMAIKSQQVENDTIRAGLAMQAYLLYTQNDGPPQNTDIYNGMYYALRNWQGRDFNKLLTADPANRHKDAVRSLDFQKANGKTYLYSVDSRGQLVRWDWNGEIITAAGANQNRSASLTRTIALSPNGEIALAGDNGQIIAVSSLDRKVGASGQKVKLHQGTTYDMVFAEALNGFISTGEDRLLRLLDYSGAGGQTLDTLAGKIYDLAISADDSYLAGVDAKGLFYLWDLSIGFDQTGDNLVRFPIKRSNNSPITRVCFSPDGQYLAYGDQSGGVFVLDLASRTIKYKLSRHKGEITGLAFHPNSSQLASASRDKTIRLWNLAQTSSLPIVMTDQPDWIMSLAFSPDGESIVAGCRNGEIKRWPTQPERMENALCGIQARKLSANEWKRYIPQLKISEQQECP